MASAAFNKFNCFVENRNEKVHNLGADALKIVLTNTAPSASNTVLANITQIANGNGYTTGGAAVTVTGSAQTGGLYTLAANNVIFTPTGPMGPFRYAVLYNSTPTSPLKPLIGWWDYGSPITPDVGEDFTVALSSGIFTDS